MVRLPKTLERILEADFQRDLSRTAALNRKIEVLQNEVARLNSRFLGEHELNVLRRNQSQITTGATWHQDKTSAISLEIFKLYAQKEIERKSLKKSFGKLNAIRHLSKR